MQDLASAYMRSVDQSAMIREPGQIVAYTRNTGLENNGTTCSQSMLHVLVTHINTPRAYSDPREHILYKCIYTLCLSLPSPPTSSTSLLLAGECSSPAKYPRPDNCPTLQRWYTVERNWAVSQETSRPGRREDSERKILSLSSQGACVPIRPSLRR